MSLFELRHNHHHGFTTSGFARQWAASRHERLPLRARGKPQALRKRTPQAHGTWHAQSMQGPATLPDVWRQPVVPAWVSSATHLPKSSATAAMLRSELSCGIASPGPTVQPRRRRAGAVSARVSGGRATEAGGPNQPAPARCHRTADRARAQRCLKLRLTVIDDGLHERLSRGWEVAAENRPGEFDPLAEILHRSTSRFPRRLRLLPSGIFVAFSRFWFSAHTSFLNWPVHFILLLAKSNTLQTMQLSSVSLLCARFQDDPCCRRWAFYASGGLR